MLDVTNLRPSSRIDFSRVFGDEGADDAWRSVEASLRALAISDGNGGVNPGDRRAIFYLTLHLRPRAVLEIGTHVGASTTSFAAALLAGGSDATLDTVDLCDVNDAATRPWLSQGVARSPREMVEQLGARARVRFVVSPSASYFAQCEETYDLIFLDGDHSERAVYEDVTSALRVLRQAPSRARTARLVAVDPHFVGQGSDPSGNTSIAAHSAPRRSTARYGPAPTTPLAHSGLAPGK